MATPGDISIKINIDRREGESNLRAFRRAFDQALRDMGRSAEEIRAFHRLAKDAAEGKVEVDALDAEARQLLDTYRALSGEAADKDLLGLAEHQAARREIEETRAAFERLKKSGRLTQAELAQAALKTEERIRALKARTNGWAESLISARGAFAGLAAGAAGLTAVVGQAVAFEAAMADVAKVVNGTQEEVDALSGRIRELAAEIPLSADELAKLAEAGGQLGVPIEKLDAFIQLASKMAVAFDLSAEQAGQAVARLSNVFDLPLERVAELGDAINTLADSSAATESAIVNVLTRVGGTARQFGLTAEQVSALATAMLSMGASSEVAGTGINAFLSKLQTARAQGKPFQDALESIGLSAEQLATAIRENPQRALTEFLHTLDQLGDQQRAEVLTRLFGQEYQDDIARLISGLDQYEQALARVTDRTGTAGSMQRVFEARVQTTEAQLQLLRNGIEAIAINLGSVFLPAVRQVAGSLGDAAAAVAQLVEQYPAIAGGATAIATMAATAGTLKIAMLALRLAGLHAFSDIATAISDANKRLPELAAEAGRAATALRVAGNLAASAWVGWEIGSSLREQFVEVERAGIALAAGLTKAAERVRFAWEVLNTKLNADTLDNISAAYDRLQSRLQAVDDEYFALWQSAGKAGEAGSQTSQQMTQAGAAIDQTGARAAVAGQQIGSLGQQLDQSTAAGSRFEQVLAGLDLTTLPGVLSLVDTFTFLGDQTKAAEQELQAYLEKLSAVDLSAFSQQLQMAYQGGQIEAERFAALNDQVLSASFSLLGINAAQALGRITPAAQESIAALDGIRQTIGAVVSDTGQRMLALEQAVAKAIGNADTASAVAALRDRIKEMGAAGELAADQVARLNTLLAEQTAQIDGATPGINSLEEAYQRLGITSQAALRRAALEARQAFEMIRNAGAPLEDQRRAWAAWGQAAVRSGDRAQQAMMAVERAVYGAGQAQDKTGAAAKRAADSLRDEASSAASASGALQHTAASADQAAGANDRLSESIRRRRQLQNSDGQSGENPPSGDNSPPGGKPPGGKPPPNEKRRVRSMPGLDYSRLDEAQLAKERARLLNQIRIGTFGAGVSNMARGQGADEFYREQWRRELRLIDARLDALKRDQQAARQAAQYSPGAEPSQVVVMRSDLGGSSNLSDTELAERVLEEIRRKQWVS